jgi:predicted enzyme related to lactoylglutathione lyase
MKIVAITLGLAVLATAPAHAQAPGPLADAIKPTGLSGFALNVVDLDKERAFYETVFGLKVATRVPATGDLREYLMSFTGQRVDRPLLILTKTAARQPGQDNYGRVVFGAPDAAALAKRAVAAGGKAPNPIREGATNMILDPEGNRIELFQPAPAAPAAAAPAPKAK